MNGIKTKVTMVPVASGFKGMSGQSETTKRVVLGNAHAGYVLGLRYCPKCLKLRQFEEAQLRCDDCAINEILDIL